MAEKDMTEKTLESYNDVFADIINVLFFGGKEVVKEEELEQAVMRSIYKTDGKLREQERDTAKYWRKHNIRISLFGLENETEPESDIPIRPYLVGITKNLIKKKYKEYNIKCENVELYEEDIAIPSFFQIFLDQLSYSK